MIRIGFCGYVELSDGGAAETAIRSCVASRGYEDVELVVFDNPLDLIESTVNPKGDNVIDLVICGTGMPGMSGIELVRDIRTTNRRASVVMCAENSAGAYEALTLQVDNYLVTPVSVAKFEEALVRSLDRVKAYHENSILLRGREGVKRIRFSQFLYAKTVDHDQEIHTTDGETCSVRISSQAFFDLLKHDARFFKAGSSYIVNVKKVKFVDSHASTARLEDGTVIAIPVRVRKSLEKTILENG